MHAAEPGRRVRASSAPRTPSLRPGVVDALDDADVVVLPPSNPVVSIGVILAVPGIADALHETAAPRSSACLPIVGGAPVRGMADACLSAIGVETTAAAVARHYGARTGTAACSTAGWSTPATPTPSPDLRAERASTPPPSR